MGAHPQGYDINAIAKDLGGPLRGKEQAIVAAALKHGISPAFFAAVIHKESSLGGISGRSQAATDGRNNFTGISGSGRPMKLGNTVEEGLDKGARLLAQYIRRHGSTMSAISKIAEIYAPTKGATNDPNKTNHTWPGGVRAKYAEYGGSGSLAANGTGNTQVADASPSTTAPRSAVTPTFPYESRVARRQSRDVSRPRSQRRYKVARRILKTPHVKLAEAAPHRRYSFSGT